MLQHSRSSVLFSSLLLAASAPVSVWAQEGVAPGVPPAEAQAGFSGVVPVSALVFDGPEPSWGRSVWLRSAEGPSLLPRVVPAGKLFIGAELEIPVMARGTLSFAEIRSGDLAVRGVWGGPELKGTLYLPDQGAHSLEPFPFTVPMAELVTDEAREREVRASRYEALAGAGVPGTAWFRRRALAAGGDPSTKENWPARRSYRTDDTFAMFSGGQGLAENLALGDVIQSGEEAALLSVPIADIVSIDVPEMDFEPLVADIEVALDPLSRAIPFDQHAVFFPSFESLVAVADQVSKDAAPLVHLFDGRSQSADVRSAYEAQMCLELDGLARTLGAQFVESVAMTGSDTYLRTGSDVAVLFQGNVPAISAMVSRRMAAAAKDRGVELTQFEVDGVTVTRAVAHGRRLSSYLASVESLVIVSNSEVQMRRVLDAAEGRVQSLDDLAEYRWFRDRYALGAGEEDALCVVSDATIRRWASPHWRIGTSRRTRAAAVLADADAWRMGLGRLANHGDKVLETRVPRGGTVTYDEGFALDSNYGSASFLTPICELEIDLVTMDERTGYESWRGDYERAWTASFDPLCIRLDVVDGGLDVDLTLVPLVARTDYRDLIEATGEAKLSATDGDFHEGAVAHWVMALDPESRLVRSATGFLSSVGNGRFGLDWLGGHLAVYVDEDEEYFESLRDVDSFDIISEEMLPGLPVGVQVGVKSPLALAGFLTGMRAYIEDAVPGMFTYETRKHGGQSYVAIVAAQGMIFDETPTVFYAVLPGAVLFSFSEKLIHGAIGRSVARANAETVDPAPWVGQSTALHIGPSFQDALAVELFELATRKELRGRSWANLAILNEWRALGIEDPVAYHEAELGTRLVCAGGGEYVWNEVAQTMESTLYGHPGAPKEGPFLPIALQSLAGMDFGLEFERIGEAQDQGLRATARLRR